MSEPVLSDELVGRVLERLGTPAPAPTAEGLARLYRAWCRGVPWDNVQKRISVVERRAVLAGAEPDEFFESFLVHGTGGTCWPSCGALYALLFAVGFRVRRAVGSMQFHRFGKAPNHGTAIVRLDGDDWLVDSSMLNERPLLLRKRELSSIEDPLHPMRAEPNDDGMWTVTWASYARDEPITCWIHEDDVSHEHFLERYEASRVPGFSHALTFRRNLASGVLSLQGHTRHFKTVDGTIASADVADRASVLVYEGGLSSEIVARLPPDEPGPAA